MDRKIARRDGPGGDSWRRAVDALAHDLHTSNQAHWPPGPHACLPEAGACLGSRLRGLPCAGQGWVRASPGQRHLRAPWERPDWRKPPEEVFRFFAKGSESGVRRGRDLGWTAAPEGRPGRLAQVPAGGSPCPPQPCSPPRPPHSAQPHRAPQDALPSPWGHGPQAPQRTPPASDTPGPMVRDGVCQATCSQEWRSRGGGHSPSSAPQAQSGARKTLPFFPLFCQDPSSLVPTHLCLRPLY